MNAAALDAAVNELIRAPQHRQPYAEKRERLLPLLRARIGQCLAAMPALERYFARGWDPPAAAADYLELPYLPVSAFKEFKLSAVAEAEVVRVLQSSATTTGVPSRVYLDKATAFRQSRALVATLIDVLGPQRRPLLILDDPQVVAAGTALGARGAAVRGLEPLAASRSFALGRTAEGADLEPDVAAMEQFFAAHRGQPVTLFGFTYLAWLHVLEPLRRRGIRFAHPEMVFLHSGGWKNLAAAGLDKAAFAAAAAEVFGCDPAAVRDFYGMVEAVGVVFVDCEAGNKHSPDFAEVAIRDCSTLRQAAPGGAGLIQVFSALPSSYPGQSLLTEDAGILLGYDDCPCGRRGLYFRFRSRVERTEIRGCGDTYAASRRLAPLEQPDVPLLRRSSVARGDLEILVPPPGRSLPEGAAAFDALRQTWLAELPARAATPLAATVALLDAAGRRLGAPEFRDIPGVAFLAMWLRRANLEQLLVANFDSRTAALDGPVPFGHGLLRAAPRGVVAHWVAGNVPTLAFFSWALAALGKNASILRVAASARDVVRRLFEAVRCAEAEVDGTRWSGEQLLRAVCAVHFPSDDRGTNEALSLAADARVVWGGEEALAAILALPRLEHCEDVVFGPKFSLAVIDRRTCGDPALRQAALQGLARDTIAFEQRGCSSPQIVFVESDAADASGLEAIAPLLDEMQRVLAQASRQTPKQPLPESAAAAILRARASYGLRRDADLRVPADLSFSILADRGAALGEALQERTLLVKLVGDLAEVLPLLGPKTQTLGVAMADEPRRRRFTEEAVLRGVSRCVPLGAMNLYENPWDGMQPIARLVRWCRM